MLRQIVTPAVRSLMRRPTAVAPVQKMYVSYGNDHHQGPTMDDLPVPNGSWEAQHKANQTKYNMHLALGTLFLATTIVIAKSSGLIYFNYSPPKMPADE